MPEVAIKAASKIKIISIYIGTIALCLLVLALVMKLWKADLSIPFAYGGDALFSSMLIKGMIDNGWFLHNAFVGMPAGLDIHDFSGLFIDNFQFLLIKFITLFSRDYAISINLYFLLTFPLTTLSSLYVMRQLNFSYVSCIVGSLLFTFLPYHFFRGENHLFLSSYYVIPLMVMVVLWIISGRGLFFQKDNSGKTRLKLTGNESVVSVVICALVASTGIYYAFFACFFLLVAGILAFRKNVCCLLTSLILIGVISLGIFANMSPSIIYRYNYGNNDAFKRSPVDSEIYGMRIAQLLMPTTGYRVPFIAELKDKYNNRFSANENDSSSLGAVGSFGFLLLVGWLFIKPKSYAAGLKMNLSLLNISAILLSTIGGFGSLFALVVSPQIRSYNRISVYIAFFSLLAVFLFLESLSCKLKKGGLQYIFYGLLGLILVIGILDQTTKYFVPPYEQLNAEFVSDANFVGEIEKSVTKNAMIFQLPYMYFPEHWPIYNMSDYELFKGYLHSRILRWSYGAMKGRESDLWQREVVAKPLDEMVEAISFAGFSGIYVNRKGYADMGADLEAKLFELFDTKPIVSSDNRLVFFNMGRYNESLKEKYTAEEFELKKDKALHPLFFTWQGGFSDLEGKPEYNWRWCSSKGKLRIRNTSQRVKNVTIKMSFATGYEEFSKLSIDGDLFKSQLKINNNDKLFSKTVTIPPGEHIIKFMCGARAVVAPEDQRCMVFRIVNFSINEVY